MLRKTKAVKPRARSTTAKDRKNVVVIPKPSIEVITEKTYVTTEPEVEIRQPGTLAQALTEPAVAVVKPRRNVRKEVISRTRRRA